MRWCLNALCCYDPLARTCRMASFFIRWHYMYGPLLGGVWGWVGLYLTVRTVESHWFVWVTQMSHLSMSIGKYKDIPEHDWPSLQVHTPKRSTSNPTP